MDTKLSINRKFKRMFANILSIVAILAIAFPFTTVAYASPSSPFVGNWEGIDVDESDIRLVIAGPPSGPYRITWTESYISFCNGEAGIVRGMGSLNEEDPNLLQATLQVSCFTTGASITFNLVWRYRPASDTLISQYEQNGYIIIWHHPGSKVPSLAPPTFVAYVPGAIEGYDWQLGDTVSIDIKNRQYTAEAEVEESPWNPAQTRVLFEVWKDGVTIEAGDHIVMTDGIVSKDVVVTDLAVTGIDVATGTVSGIYDPDYSLWVWLYDGEGQVPDTNPETGTWTATFIELPPGAWGGATQWEPDGDGTSLDFQVPNPTLVAYLPVTIVGYDWPMGDTIDLNIEGKYTTQAEVGNADWDPTIVLFELGEFSMEAGDHIVMTDEVAGITKDIWVANLAATDFDLNARQVFGTYTYDPGSESENYLWVWLYDKDGQVPTMNPDGTWVATFDELPPGAWGGATQWDDDGDGTSIDFQLPNPNLYAVPDENKIYAQEWIAGIQLDLKIYDSDGNIIHSDSQVVESPSEVPWTVVVFDYDDLSPRQRIVLDQRGYERELLVSSLIITTFDLANKQVIGTGDAGAQIFIRINGEDVWGEVDGDGNWAISHPQLAPGVWGEAIQPDGIDGDETRDGFQAPFE